MSEKKKLKDKETEKVDGGFPILIGIPSPAKVTPQLSDSAEDKTKKPFGDIKPIKFEEPD